MPTPWLQLGNKVLNLEDLPPLLERSQLLTPLFQRMLVESSLASIEVTQDEQLAFQKRFLDRQGITDKDSLDQWLQRNNLTEQQASINILESLKLERFKAQRFGPRVEQVFLETKHTRDRVVYSLLRVKEHAAALELHLRLDEGDSTFTELCGVHSEGPERDTGGLIGPIPLGRLHPQMAELLRISSPGQLWPPMEIDGWWVIVRLDKKLPAQLDNAMEIQIRDECFDVWLRESLESLLTAYRAARPHSDDESLASIALPDD